LRKIDLTFEGPNFNQNTVGKHFSITRNKNVIVVFTNDYCIIEIGTGPMRGGGGVQPVHRSGAWRTKKGPVNL
jgi:hypothetical protein